MPSISLDFDRPELARHYEAVSTTRQFTFGQQLIADLRISLGEHVLDVGCGTGLLAEYVAGQVGPQGSVVGIDPLPLRIELARQKSRPNLRFEVADAQDLDAFADASFEAVYLNAVFHWIPDKARALSEIFRVLKPGGRLGIATGSRDHVSGVQAVKAAVFSRPPYNEFPQSQAGRSLVVSADELKTLLAAAGFSLAVFEIRPKVNFFPTPSALIDFSEASSFGNLLGHLPEHLRAQARGDIEIALEQSRTTQGIPQGGANLIAVASKP